MREITIEYKVSMPRGMSIFTICERANQKWFRSDNEPSDGEFKVLGGKGNELGFTYFGHAGSRGEVSDVVLKFLTALEAALRAT